MIDVIEIIVVPAFGKADDGIVNVPIPEVKLTEEAVKDPELELDNV